MDNLPENVKLVNSLKVLVVPFKTDIGLHTDSDRENVLSTITAGAVGYIPSCIDHDHLDLLCDAANAGREIQNTYWKTFHLRNFLRRAVKVDDEYLTLVPASLSADENAVLIFLSLDTPGNVTTVVNKMLSTPEAESVQKSAGVTVVRKCRIEEIQV